MLMVLALCGPQISEAALIISVDENSGTNTVDFSWNGIIGSSGVSLGSESIAPDFINPSMHAFLAADRIRGDVSNSWDSIDTYAGTPFGYGSGGAFTEFLVTGNIPFGVNPKGLLVGSITDGGTDSPDLSTQVFSGSFSLPGNFATYGLFDTPGADITAGPVTLWTADTGSGSVVFQQANSGPAVPEPSSLALLSLSGLGGLYLMRRRRRKPENQPSQRRVPLTK